MMKFLWIIALAGVPQALCMSYKDAALVSLSKNNMPFKNATVTLATPDEQEEIINDLRILQARPGLITPRVDTALTNKEINEKYKNNQGYYSLTEIAVSLGTTAAGQWLLEQMQKPEMFQEALEALKEYITNKDHDKVKQLLQWTACDANGNSCLIRYRDRINTSFAHLTLEDPDMLSLVLDSGANPDALNQEYVTPLHRAARKGNLESVKRLLRAGANPNVQVTNRTNPFIETPLLSAIFKFRNSRNKHTQYLFFKIAAYLVINKEGSGGNADYDAPNSVGISAKDMVGNIRGNSREVAKLKDLMLYRKPPSFRSSDSNAIISLANTQPWRRP